MDGREEGGGREMEAGGDVGGGHWRAVEASKAPWSFVRDSLERDRERGERERKLGRGRWQEGQRRAAGWFSDGGNGVCRVAGST